MLYMSNKWKLMCGGKLKISNEGDVFLTKSDRLSVAGLNANGYRQVNLGKNNVHLVHRLVAQAFIKNPHNYSDVNHKNGNKIDNRVENLEWCTRSFNTLNQWETGLVNTRGERSTNAKISEVQAKKIKELYKAGGYSQSKLGVMFGVSQTHIGDIILGQRWKHI